VSSVNMTLHKIDIDPEHKEFDKKLVIHGVIEEA
jgi:hypothetical protein